MNAVAQTRILAGVMPWVVAPGGAAVAAELADRAPAAREKIQALRTGSA